MFKFTDCFIVIHISLLSRSRSRYSVEPRATRNTWPGGHFHQVRKRVGFHFSLLSPRCAFALISLTPVQGLTVCELGALPDLDNVTVRIADVAARLAILRDRLGDELGSSAFP